MRTALRTAAGVLFCFGLLGCTPVVKRPNRIDGRSIAPYPPPRVTDEAGPQPGAPGPVTRTAGTATSAIAKPE